VTGKFYYRQLPKADVRLIIFGLILFFSILLPIVQYQKWQTAVNYLRYASLNNLPLKAGGTKQTVEIYRRAVEKYEEKTNPPQDATLKGKAPQKVKPSKLTKDPLFIQIVDEVFISSFCLILWVDRW
jgi:hypothetical protein